MSITFDKKTALFQLDTDHSSYIIGIADGKYPGHVYYGSRLRRQDASYLMRAEEYPFVPSENPREEASFMDFFPSEYPGNQIGDFRDSAISVIDKNGHSVILPVYKSYEILDTKPVLLGLPSSFAGDEKVDTLVLHLVDGRLNLEIDLLYSVFEKEDVITRSVNITNNGDAIKLTKIMSMSFDMDDENFEMLSLYGSWARERKIQRRMLSYGKQSVGSVRGESSHQMHPFMACLDKNATQTSGEVYGMSFVYSGNFIAQIEKSQFGSVRLQMGINPEGFTWILSPGDMFTAPEVVMTYSDQGLGKMTRSYHDFFRNHLIRSKYAHQKRPILINNWEGTYFDFDADKLLDIARSASECGIEMFVMDDGWFGKRDDDNSGLGDWFVNEKKLVGGLPYLVNEINKLGMKFGIWFEPEMVSPDSDLYRAHPDWAISVPGRGAALARNQYVLDIGRKEVRDAVYDMVSSILKSANIEYVKWDMNRPLTDIGSSALSSEAQGEIFHRFVLGVYDLQERLVSDFPDLLLENCSSGGARFDPGMLYYSPQIWTSDDTDAVERLSIQEGTQLVYPLSTMGAHVSACPNDGTGRDVPFETRGHVALAGTFGYELDATRFSDEEKAKVKEQIKMYHRYNDLVREGDYYRIASYQDNHYYDAYMVVSKDKTKALVTYVQVLGEINYKSRRIRLQGLDADRDYNIESESELLKDMGTAYGTYGGDLLMEAGINVPRLRGDYRSVLFYLESK